MIFSPERRARLTYLTASEVFDGTRVRQIVIESRPTYAILQLEGTNVRYSVAWEKIFELARNHHQLNLELEATAVRKLERIKKAS